MLRGPTTPVVALALLLGGTPACTRGSVDPGFHDGGKAQDGRILLVRDAADKDRGKQDAARPPDFLLKIDLPTKVGNACHYGQCGKGLICMANLCLKQCTEPQPGCNAKTSQCAPDKTCMWASTFTGACIEATAKYLQPCGQGKVCEQGTLCVIVSNNSAKCLRLCQYGCPAGVPCGKTNNGCSICIQ